MYLKVRKKDDRVGRNKTAILNIWKKEANKKGKQIWAMRLQKA